VPQGVGVRLLSVAALFTRLLHMKRSEIDQVCKEHDQWFALYKDEPLIAAEWRNWKRRLTFAPESAWSEAAVRRLLTSEQIGVRPYSPNTGNEKRPDFLCEANGAKFVVEVTCITDRALTDATLVGPPDHGISAFDVNELPRRISDEISRKAPVCSVAKLPAMVAVASWSNAPATWDAGILAHEIFGGRSVLKGRVNTKTGDAHDTWVESTFEGAAFLAVDKSTGELRELRKSISAALVADFAGIPRTIFVVRNPHANRPLELKFQGIQVS